MLSNYGGGGGPFERMYREVFRDNIPSTLCARLIARQKSISLKKLSQVSSSRLPIRNQICTKTITCHRIKQIVATYGTYTIGLG